MKKIVACVIGVVILTCAVLLFACNKNTEEIMSTATAVGEPEPTATPTVEPGPTASVDQSAMPIETPTATPTGEPSVTPTENVTVTPTREPMATPSENPTASGEIASTPTIKPTSIPTSTPTIRPTSIPTSTPTIKPTAIPTSTPTITPTITPTATPKPTETATPTPTFTPETTPTPTPAVVHDFVAFTVITKPSNTEEGELKSVCTICGEEKIEKIAKISKDDYLVVPYIEGTGSQGIDTGFTINKEDSGVLRIDFQNLDTETWKWMGADYYLGFTTGYLKTSDRAFYDIYYNYDDEYNEVILENGEMIIIERWKDINLQNVKICLFTLGDKNNTFNKNHKIKSRIYGAEVGINHVLRAHYIPVINMKTNRPGLFDIINNEFLDNCYGDGTFTVNHEYMTEITKMPTATTKGEYKSTCLVCGYEKIDVISPIDTEKYEVLEYVDFNGTQYINTQIEQTDDTAISLHMYNYNWNNRYVYGARQDFSNGYFIYNGLYSNDRLEYNWAAVFYTPSKDVYMSQSVDGKECTIKINSETFVREIGKADNNTIYIGAINNPTVLYHKGVRVYYFKITQGGKLVRDFVPAKRLSDGAIGFYDNVSKTFFENNGTGEFDYKSFKPDDINDYDILPELVFDNTNYVKLIEYNLFDYEIDGKSFDGEEILPFVNGVEVMLGASSKNSKSQMFSIYSIKSISDGVVIHEYVPVMRKSDKKLGLFDVVTNSFREAKYNETEISSYFFENLGNYNQKISEFAIYSHVNVYETDTKLLNEGFKLVASYMEKDLESGEVSNRSAFYLYLKNQLRNGEVYHLYYLLIKGTSGNGEWISNCDIGNNLDFHQGFKNAANFVMEYLIANAEKDSLHNKLIISGHSRGAAVGSIIAAMLMENKEYFVEENLVAYCYACPNYSLRDVKYYNIYQIINVGDLVTFLPSSDWGFHREGVEVKLKTSAVVLKKLRDILMEYQRANGLKIVGYEGYTTSVERYAKQLSELVSKEALLDPNNREIVLKILLTYLGQESLSIPDILKAFTLLNQKISSANMYEMAKFISESTEKNSASHGVMTYYAWVKASAK